MVEKESQAGVEYQHSSQELSRPHHMIDVALAPNTGSRHQLIKSRVYNQEMMKLMGNKYFFLLTQTQVLDIVLGNFITNHGIQFFWNSGQLR